MLGVAQTYNTDSTLSKLTANYVIFALLKPRDLKMTDSRKRPYSSVVVDGLEKAAARAMLHAVGFSSEDFQKPQIGVASTWSNLTPCNMHINDLAEAAAIGIEDQQSKAITFNTITVSDGISMGSPGMRYSLVSREVIADSIETVVAGQGFDGFVAIGGCDKNMPGCAMAMARLNRPSIFVYGGTIQPGKDRRDVISVFEAVGQYASGNLSEIDLKEIEATAIPGPGSCGGMYTANTMASAIEALGLSLPNSSAQEAISDNKRQDSQAAGEAVVKLVEQDIKPSDILSREAFENAITVTIALEGSTNAVLHLLAIAHAADIPLTIDDFSRIGKQVPVLADMRPAGQYSMSELIQIGGIQPLMKTLLEAGLLHGHCLTVTGKTLAENLANVAPYPTDQQVIRPMTNPVKKDSHLVILRGNLAPEGAVAKITGHEGLQFTGTAKCFKGEEAALEAILAGRVVAGDVIVIRYEGPKGGPGMREMLSPTSALNGRGLSADVALITDGRFSGGSHGFVIGHITPEAFLGGPIALIKDGDNIIIDAQEQTITVELDPKELVKRRASWIRPDPYTERGVLAKYAKLVSSASLGAVTD
jgi:dihydroxy-acid dehydratase